MSGYRHARVTVLGVFAGILAETEGGYTFSYLPEYVGKRLPAVSLTLPVQSAAYESRTLFPFFDGLIPEGWLLDIVVHNWKLNPEDRFSLLLASCKDCIGDVSIIPEDGI